MLPFEPVLFQQKVNVHLLLEYVAFFAAYRYYVYLKRRTKDPITSGNRLSIILGAAIGAFLGSRIIGFLENPFLDFDQISLYQLMNIKTIMGGLFGGLIGVEITKRSIGETNSSGDLFTLPLILGIFIGRIGCFLVGTNEFTYGAETELITGMDLGDGLSRHPLALYELVFLLFLFIGFRHTYRHRPMSPGMLFKMFMLTYFGFRFTLEFLKPNVFFVLGLSSIQWLCITCFIYYRKTLTSLSRAYQKVYIL